MIGLRIISTLRDDGKGSHEIGVRKFREGEVIPRPGDRMILEKLNAKTAKIVRAAKNYAAFHVDRVEFEYWGYTHDLREIKIYVLAEGFFNPEERTRR